MTTDEKIKLITEFLLPYGTPLITTINPVENSDAGKMRVVESVLTAVTKNESLPHNVYFTPNGNFGINNTNIGTKIKFSDKRLVAPYYNAIVLDIDPTKDNDDGGANIKGKEKLLKKIEDVNAALGIIPSRIIETRKGYHIHFITEETDREAIHKDFGDDIFKISKFLSTQYSADQGCVATVNTNAILRLPYCNAWTKDGDIATTVKVISDTGKRLSYQMIEIALANIEANNKAIETRNTVQKYREQLGSKAYTEISKIPLPEICDRLPARVFDGREYTIQIQNNGSIAIDYTDTGRVIPDGYKYNKSGNYIHNFSFENHPISERPRGGPYAVVKHRFKENKIEISKFFLDNFGISTQVQMSGAGAIVERVVESAGVQIHFTTKGVSKVETNTEKMLFRKPINIIGKCKTKKAKDYMESADEQTVYIVEADGTRFMMYYQHQKNGFNKAYGNKMFFYGVDNDLGIFYECLDNAERIPRIDLITLNGYFGNTAVLGGQPIYSIANDEEKYHYDVDSHFTIHNGEQLHIIDYFKELTKVFDKSITYPALLQTLALAGMNLWSDMLIYPGLLLTGPTGCGKSSLAMILKHMCGYAWKSRKYNMGKITAQPLSQASTDGAILHLEELTNNTSFGAEQLLRNIINRDTGARGTGTGNLYYNYRSPLLITGERAFTDESLNNRFMGLYMTKKHWTEKNPEVSKEILKNLVDACASDEIYSTYLAKQEQVVETYERQFKKITGQIDGRHADVWAFMFAMNELFEIGIPQKELIDIAVGHLGVSGFLDVEEKTPEAQLKTLLIKGVFSKELHYSYDDDTKKYMFFIIKRDYRETNRNAFGYIMKQLAELYGEKDKVTASSDGIAISIREDDPSTADSALYRVVESVVKNLYTKVARHAN